MSTHVLFNLFNNLVILKKAMKWKTAEPLIAFSQ